MNKPLDDAILHIIKTESCSQDRERLLLELQRDFVKGESLGLFLHRELEDYCKERNPGVEYIIILGLVLNVFDDNKNLIDVLARLIDQDWHFAHEDIVSALEMIGGDETLSALEGAARSRPHLSFHGGRSGGSLTQGHLGDLEGPNATGAAAVGEIVSRRGLHDKRPRKETTETKNEF